MKLFWIVCSAFLLTPSIALAVQPYFQPAGAMDRNPQQEHELRNLQARIKAHPDDVQALMSLGSLYIAAGKLTEAEPWLARAAKLDPKSSAIRLNWAALLARLHRYQEAESALRGVSMPVEPARRIGFWRIKASIALALGDAAASARDMEAALDLAPQNFNLLLGTGLTEIQAKEWSKAIRHLAPVFEATHDPHAGLGLLQAQTQAHQDVSQTLAQLDALSVPPNEDVPFRVQIGGLLASAGMPSQAAAEFERAVQESPPRAELLYDLALAQFNAGQADAALASAQRARATADSADIESALGDIEEKRGDSLAAVHSYQAAVRLDPDSEQYRMALGLELLQHQTYKAALAVFQNAVQRFPSSARMHIALGITDYLLEDYNGAAKDLMAAGSAGNGGAFAYQYLGETQLEQPGSPAPAAVAQLCRYSSAHPQDGKLMAYCGALMARVDHDRGKPAPAPHAMRRLQAATQLVPNDPVARCELGKAYEERKQWTAAEENLEACARLTPDSPEVHYRLARVCAALKDQACAQHEVKLHDAAVQKVVSANAGRDRTLRKFLYTLKAGDARKSGSPVPVGQPHL